MLYAPEEMEVASHCVDSVLEIRRFLSGEMGKERENFVYGYVQGYGHGMNESCLVQYSNVKVSLSKGPDFTQYTTAITDFYTKHP